MAQYHIRASLNIMSVLEGLNAPKKYPNSHAESSPTQSVTANCLPLNAGPRHSGSAKRVTLHVIMCFANPRTLSSWPASTAIIRVASALAWGNKILEVLPQTREAIDSAGNGSRGKVLRLRTLWRPCCMASEIRGNMPWWDPPSLHNLDFIASFNRTKEVK